MVYNIEFENTLIKEIENHAWKRFNEPDKNNGCQTYIMPHLLFQ